MSIIHVQTRSSTAAIRLTGRLRAGERALIIQSPVRHIATEAGVLPQELIL